MALCSLRYSPLGKSGERRWLEVDLVGAPEASVTMAVTVDRNVPKAFELLDTSVGSAPRATSRESQQQLGWPGIVVLAHVGTDPSQRSEVAVIERPIDQRSDRHSGERTALDLAFWWRVFAFGRQASGVYSVVLH